MKIRTLIVSILGILVVSSMSLAQNAEAPEQKPQEPAFQQSDSPTPAQPKPSFVVKTAPTPTPQVPRSRRLTTKPTTRTLGVRPTPIQKNLATVTRVFMLKHVPVEDVEEMLLNVFSIQRVYSDRRSNKLIVQAIEGQLKEVQSLIEEMDVPGVEASTSRDVQNLIYRIYMFEIASGDEDMKPFTMILRTTTHVSSQELLDAAADKDLQISEFLQSNDFDVPNVEILIQGKAASNESLTRMVEKFPDSHIIELKWDDDETFTNNIAAAQYTQLPVQMQKHIRKLLGDGIRTVGYWFGNLSVPGKVQAPIGPWTLTLQLDTESDHMLELDIDVVMPQILRTRFGSSMSPEILSNTIRAKIGKPIIIGYNRKSYGTRKMGAMVIVPEADSLQSDAAPTNPNRF